MGKVLATLKADSSIVPVRMVNVADVERKILAGANLAKCEMVDCVVDVDRIESHERDSLVSSTNVLPGCLRTLFDDSVKELDDEDQRRQVYNLLCENADLFAKGSTDLGKTDIVTHQINTGLAKPIKQRPRRLPQAKRHVARQAVKDMLQQEIIEPSASLWSSLVVL